MALQIIPWQHLEDSNGSPYVGAKQYIYLPNTTTLASVYTDIGLSIAAANPATANASGNFPRRYIAAGTYKMRNETSAGVLIGDEFDYIDTGLSAGSGALPIASGGTGGTTATAARTNLGVPSVSELTDLSDEISGIQTTLQNIVSVPQGRLSLTSGVPVLASGVSAGTAVYYMPYLGNLLPIYDGSLFNTESFSELTLTLNSNHVANAIYDVFAFINSAAVVIGTGPAWNTATAGAGARGSGAGTTEITRSIGGLLTIANAMTARNGATTYSVAANQGTYLGTLFMDASNGQLTCHTAYGQSRKWGVWNVYNRMSIIMKAGDGTSSWTYGTATVRPSNNASTNSISIMTGLAEECFDLEAIQQVNSGGNAGSPARVGIGYNSTTAMSGTAVGGAATSTNSGSITASLNYAGGRYSAPPALGVQTITMLETPGEASSKTFYGTEGSMLLTAQYRG